MLPYSSCRDVYCFFLLFSPFFLLPSSFFLLPLTEVNNGFR
ncbi:MAG: hypothetical protein ACRCT1_04685 [Microcoleaceae cyanobacterium]